MMELELRRLLAAQERSPEPGRLRRILDYCGRAGLNFVNLDPSLRELVHDRRCTNLVEELNALLPSRRFFPGRAGMGLQALAESGGYLVPSQARRFMQLALPSTRILSRSPVDPSRHRNSWAVDFGRGESIGRVTMVVPLDPAQPVRHGDVVEGPGGRVFSVLSVEHTLGRAGLVGGTTRITAEELSLSQHDDMIDSFRFANRILRGGRSNGPQRRRDQTRPPGVDPRARRPQARGRRTPRTRR